MNLKRGDKCFVYTIGSDVEETTVLSVGSKYITVNIRIGASRYLKFDSENGQQITDYSARFRLYEKMEQYTEYVERENSCRMLNALLGTQK